MARYKFSDTVSIHLRTTGLAAKRTGRNATLIELNPAYCQIIRDRLA